MQRLTKTSIILTITLISLSTLYLLLCSIAIINTQPGSLYKYSTTDPQESKNSSLEYKDPKPLNVLEEIANTFNIPVRTLSLTITLLTSLLWGILIYTSTANTVLALVTMLMIFFISKIFLGV